MAPDTKDSSLPCTGISPLLPGGGGQKPILQHCFRWSPPLRQTVNSGFSRRHPLVPLSQVTLPLRACPSEARCPQGDCTCHLSLRDCCPPVSLSVASPFNSLPLRCTVPAGPWGGVGSQPPPSWLLPPPGPRLSYASWLESMDPVPSHSSIRLTRAHTFIQILEGQSVTVYMLPNSPTEAGTTHSNIGQH